MPFHLTWEALGRGQGNINYYTIDTRRFGGWEYAVPLDCYQALNAAGYMNQLGVANAAEPVRWYLKKVENNVVTQSLGSANNPIESNASASQSGCIENDYHWPKIGGKKVIAKGKQTVAALANSGASFFTANATIIIYSTWQPCLACCNALFSLARNHNLNLNIIVRYEIVYSDVDTAKRVMQGTLIIPKSTSILSTRNPAPADRCVFVFYDTDLNINARSHQGAMIPPGHHSGFTSPHMYPNPDPNDRMHPGLAPCSTLNRGNAQYGWGNARDPVSIRCAGCDKEAPSPIDLNQLSSGVPWATHQPDHVGTNYRAQHHYAHARLQ